MRAFHPLGRLGRTTAMILGGILLMMGTAALSFLMVFAITTIRSYLEGHSPTYISPDERGMLLLSLAASLIAPIVGSRLIGSTRRIALFLRRFGRVEATQAVSYAVEESLGRSWRLVTLDDAGSTPHPVEAIGVRASSKRLIQGLSVVWLTVAGFGLWLVIRSPAESGAGSGTQRGVAQPLLDWIFPAGDGPTDAVDWVWIGVKSGAVLLAMRVLLNLLIRLVFPFAKLQKDEARAEEARRWSIETEEDVRSVARRVLRRSRRFFSPQLFVVRVTGALWTDAVRRLASTSSAVIVDVSEPSENLLWEIENLRPGTRRVWIFVRSEVQVGALAKRDVLDSSPSSLSERLAGLLREEHVLVYADSPERMDRFAAELHDRMT